MKDEMADEIEALVAEFLARDLVAAEIEGEVESLRGEGRHEEALQLILAERRIDD